MNRIFISYRREDSADVTGRIYDHLVNSFGRENVFKDVDAIPYGADFREEIRKALSYAGVFLAVIGTRWLSALGKDSRRRVDSPNDFVRIEVEAALRRDLRVIPLLVRGGLMPSEAELPEAIKALSYRHAIAIRDDPDFHRDMNRLIASMSNLIDQNAGSRARTDASGKKEDGSAQSRLMSYSIQEIEEQLKRRLFGQEIAIQQVMPWIKRLRFGLLRDDKAAATFLFVGQSGLGKTVLAKELARVVCGDEERLVLFETTLLQGPAANTMLIGAQPGHIGYGEGKLVNALRDAPASVLFFNEIEKAEPQVGDLLRRFLDSGFIQDAAGPIRDGREAVIILSTNLRPSPSSQKHSSDDAIQATIKSVRDRFSPEFLATIDEVVCFLPFSRSASREIVDLAIDRDVLRLSQARGIRLVVDELARELITEEFHKLSLSQGARAASGVVHRLVTLPLIDYVFTQPPGAIGSESEVLHATLDEKSKIVIRPST